MTGRIVFAAPLVLAAAGLSAQAQAPEGAAVTPDAGAVHGEGTIVNREGQSGTWSVDAVLSGGDFTGTGIVNFGGMTVNGTLDPRRSYLENGRCYFEIVEGRSHVTVGGNCTTTALNGNAQGFIAGLDGTPNGTVAGTLRFGAAGAARTARAEAPLPTAKLTCAWMERIGGNVGGQDYHYALRISNMGTLTLSPGGTYRTTATSGRFVREGDAVRLTSGAFAGAVGRLRPDRSGVPAVYFERDENKRPDGVHIVDPARTACTVARGG